MEADIESKADEVMLLTVAALSRASCRLTPFSVFGETVLSATAPIAIKHVSMQDNNLKIQSIAKSLLCYINNV